MAQPSLRATLLLLALAVACVGPSRTDDDYLEKAANTAEATRSAVQTARLVGEAASDGRASGPYSALVLSEAEDDAASVARSFSVVQPPSDQAEQLREELTTLLDEVQAVLSELRIAARQGETTEVGRLAGDLPRLAEQLERFMALTPT